MNDFSLAEMSCFVEKLSPRKRILFALSCAERLLPNYVDFSSREHFGNPRVLRESLDFAWDHVGARSSAIRVADLIEKCLEVTPDTDDFHMISASAALNAGASACSVLSMLEDSSAARAIEVATLARDTVDMFVQVRDNMPPNDAEIESKIADHPLMQEEVRRQKECLDLLSVLSEEELDIDELRRKWSCLETSNIGISVKRYDDSETVPDVPGHGSVTEQSDSEAGAEGRGKRKDDGLPSR
jgi:hypothetical protein